MFAPQSPWSALEPQTLDICGTFLLFLWKGSLLEGDISGSSLQILGRSIGVELFITDPLLHKGTSEVNH